MVKFQIYENLETVNFEIKRWKKEVFGDIKMEDNAIME